MRRLPKGGVYLKVSPVRAHLNRVVFVRDAGEAETAGGIVVPLTARRPSQWGEVVDVGPRVEEVRIGDRVLVDLWQGFQVLREGVEYWVVDEGRVLARELESGRK